MTPSTIPLAAVVLASANAGGPTPDADGRVEAVRSPARGDARTGGGDGRSILFFITGLYRGGGAETQMVRVATHLAARGWRVTVVSLMPVLQYGAVLQGAGVSVASLDIPRGRYDPRALTRLVALLRREAPDVLCTFMFHANVLGRVAARLAGTHTVVSSVRNTSFGGAWAERLLRWTDPLCQLTTTNSQRAADELVARGLVRRGAMRVVPNAIDVDSFAEVQPDRSALEAELGASPGDFVWLSVGRLEPQKGHGVTLEALARLSQHVPATPRLALVGEGSEREALIATAERLGVATQVRLLGLRDDVPRLLRSADAMVLASRWEGLPNVVLEAHASGTPVVATRVGGVPELIEDGITGQLADPDDPAALADAMERLMTLPDEERRAMAERARGEVRERFSPAVVMADWEALFEELLNRSRPSRYGPVTP